MSTFTSEIVVPHPIAEVFAWHERPGALPRLCPPWNSSVAAEPSNGIQPGSIAKLNIQVPGTLGKAAVTWVAEHVDLEVPTHFSDIMAKGPLRSWRHDHRFASIDDGTATRLTDEISYQAPVPLFGSIQSTLVNRTLEQNFAYRGRQLVDDLAFHAAHTGDRLTVAIAGSSGMIGTQLAALLSTGGHTVRRLVRGPAHHEGDISWDPAAGTIDREALRAVDAVIHLGGHTIGGRFTEANKRAILESRAESTSLLARTIAELLPDGGPATFICSSAIGYYGSDRTDEVLTEESPSGDGFLAEVCRVWEDSTEAARLAGARVVNVRTGIVQSPVGGALAKQLPLFLLGAGGRLGSGKQWQSWISIDDIVGVFAHALLTPSISGPLNGVGPEPVTGAEYAKVLGRVVHRPSILPVPSFGPKLLLGSEGADEIVLASQRVNADHLLATGYEFRHPTLEVALRHVLGR